MACRRAIRLFFFNDTATTEIYTLSLHDALPILHERGLPAVLVNAAIDDLGFPRVSDRGADRSEEHTSELQSPDHLVCRLLLGKKKHRSTPPPPQARVPQPLASTRARSRPPSGVS